jgi:uncharacterized membrane protein (UPF0127 family)
MKKPVKYLEYNGKIISGIEAVNTDFKQRLGLMFRAKLPRNISLLFTVDKSTITGIHMLFVFFPIDVIFLNENLQVIKLDNLNQFTGYSHVENTTYIIETKSNTIKDFNIKIRSQLQIKTF